MRQIPVITKNLLILNIVCYVIMSVMSGHIDLNSVFGLHYWQATEFHLYQCFTYMFMHGGLTHLFFNMFALWMFGGIVERTFGQKRFIIYYIVCGLGAALCQELSQTAMVYSDIISQGAPADVMFNLPDSYRNSLNALTTVGASGAIYGILLAFGMSYPEERMFVFPLPVPIKAKWFVCGYAAIELLSAMSQRGDGVAHVAHLGGMLFGYVLIKMWRKTSYSFNGWDGYEIHERKTILGKIREWLHLDKDSQMENGKWFRSAPEHQQERKKMENSTSTQENKHSSDWNYNATKKKEETEIDIILDKIRRSGYASLTEEEKKKLFEQSKFKKV